MLGMAAAFVVYSRRVLTRVGQSAVVDLLLLRPRPFKKCVIITNVKPKQRGRDLRV